jgi:hypothetical protein
MNADVTIRRNRYFELTLNRGVINISGVGNMTKAVYDPNLVEDDAFDMANMVESTTEKIFTSTERSKLTGIEALAEVNNISDADATDLTDGGETSLHTHDHDNLNGIDQAASGVANGHISDGAQTIAGAKELSSGLTIDAGFGAGNGLSFGDGDTGFYESVDDILRLNVGGTDIYNALAGFLHGQFTSHWALRNIPATATAPNLLPRYTDTNTGIGRAADDQLSLIAGGTEIARLEGDSDTKLVVNPDGAVGSGTGLFFGDGDSGFYEVIDDTIVIYLAGANRFLIDESGMFGAAIDAPYIRNLTSTSTTPNIVINKNDANTGLGSNAADQLSLIAGASEGARVETTQVSLQAPNSASTPHKNGSISFDLDETGNNLKVRVLYSDGTSKTGTLALV